MSEKCRRSDVQLKENAEVWSVYERAIYLITLSGDSSLWVSLLDIPIYTFFRNILVSEVSSRFKFCIWLFNAIRSKIGEMDDNRRKTCYKKQWFEEGKRSVKEIRVEPQGMADPFGCSIQGLVFLSAFSWKEKCAQILVWDPACKHIAHNGIVLLFLSKHSLKIHFKFFIHEYLTPTWPKKIKAC